MTENQLNAFNLELVATRNQITELTVAIEKATEVIQTNYVDAMIDSLEEVRANERLLQSYRTNESRLNDNRARCGPDHQSIGRIEAELAALRGQIINTFTSNLEGDRRSLLIAQSKKNEIEANLEASKERSFVDNNKLVELRELERTYETYQKMHEGFLLRQQQAYTTRLFSGFSSTYYQRSEHSSQSGRTQKSDNPYHELCGWSGAWWSYWLLSRSCRALIPKWYANQIYP